MEEKIINVSILQMSSIIGDVESNIAKAEKIIEEQLDPKSDLLIFPEVWTCGWSCSDFIKTAQKTDNNKVISFLSYIAKKYNTNIIGGSYILEKEENYFNNCPAVNRNGTLLDSYNKMHLYSYYGCNEGEYITKGDHPVMVDFDGIKIGLSICYDIRFPELYRAYRKAGADIFVNCAAWGSNKPIPWEMMTKSRAVENQTFMIALTQCGKIKENEYNLGESRIIDYKGEEINAIYKNEGIINGSLNISQMYDFRNKCTILNDIANNYEVKTLCKK